jgi:hypothetical protein
LEKSSVAVGGSYCGVATVLPYLMELAVSNPVLRMQGVLLPSLAALLHWVVVVVVGCRSYLPCAT